MLILTICLATKLQQDFEDSKRLLLIFFLFNAIWVGGWQVLSGGTEVHSELVQQVLLFIYQNKGLRIVEVCDFLRPFLNFSVLRIAFSDSSASSFVRHLVSSTASLCCSCPRETLPVFKLLMGCLRYYPQKNVEVSCISILLFLQYRGSGCHYFLEVNC